MKVTIELDHLMVKAIGSYYKELDEDKPDARDIQKECQQIIRGYFFSGDNALSHHFDTVMHEHNQQQER